MKDTINNICFRKNNLSYQIGFSIVMFLAAIVWLATFFFLVGVPIQSVTVPLAIISAILITVYTGELPTHQVIRLVISTVSIVFVCAVISTYVYDFSFDGNTYHKTTIGMLKNGWNPVYESFENAALTSKIIPDDYEWPIWYDHYPKASWIIGAAFYRLSGNIETGKCMNMLMCVAVFLMLAGRLEQYQILGRITRIVFASVSVITPVTLPQIQSYYNDGMMQMLIYAALVSLVNLSLAKEKNQCKQDWLCLFAVIHIALNIKYSGLIFMGLYCGGFYFYWVIRHICSDKKIDLQSIWKITAFYCITVGSAICFTGSTSYMRNLIQHKNLLYTMVGTDKIEIITSMLPDEYARKPYIIQFLMSLFSRAANISAGSEMSPELKIPFTFNRAEWETGSLFDLRIGAWGILFSGIFLISVCVIVVMLVSLHRNKKNDRCVFDLVVLVISLTVVQVLFVPGLAWARYYSHLFLLPMMASGFLLYNRQNKGCLIIGHLLIVIMLLNVGNFAYYSVGRINQSQDIRHELEALSNISRKQEVAIHLNGGVYTQGYLFNLMDAGVDYIVDPDMEDGITIFNWRINYKELS